MQNCVWGNFIIISMSFIVGVFITLTLSLSALGGAVIDWIICLAEDNKTMCTLWDSMDLNTVMERLTKRSIGANEINEN